jgi:hypothetical protein
LSGRRRELMLQSYLGKNHGTKEKGNKVLSAFASEIGDSKNSEKYKKLKYKKQEEINKLLKRQNCLKSAQINGSDVRDISRGRRLTRMEALSFQ